METPTPESRADDVTTANSQRLVTVAWATKSDLIRIIYDHRTSEATTSTVQIGFSIVFPVRHYGKIRVALAGARATLRSPADRLTLEHDREIKRIPVKRMGQVGSGTNVYILSKRMGYDQGTSQTREYDASTEIDYAQCQPLTNDNRADSHGSSDTSTAEVLIKRPNPFTDVIDDEISFSATGAFEGNDPAFTGYAAHLLVTPEGEPIFRKQNDAPLSGLARALAKREYQRNRIPGKSERASMAFVVEVNE